MLAQQICLTRDHDEEAAQAKRQRNGREGEHDVRQLDRELRAARPRSAYLHEVLLLLLLPTWPEEDMIGLSPLRWAATRMRDDVIVTLAERSLLGRSRPAVQA